MEKFVSNLFKPEEASIIAFGVPLGKGSLETLNRLREVSRAVEPFDLERKRNLLEGIKLADIGNIELKELDDIFKKTAEIVKKGKIPIVLGGSHLLTLYTLGAFEESIRVVIFDAHCDLKDSYLDKRVSESFYPFKFEKKVALRYNCSTWLRRFCEVGTKNVALIGVRSCDEDELKFMEENKILYLTPSKVRSGDIEKELREFIKDFKVYLSIDMDFFDPSIAPGVQHPEPNGLFFSEFQNLIKIFKGKIIGLDLVEIFPLKENRITEFLAIKAVFEVISHIF